MDLEKMKQNWAIISEQLAQQEITNNKIVKEIISQKAQSAHEKIYKRNVANLLNIVFGGILLAFINFMLDDKLEPVTFTLIESYIVIGFLYHLYLIFIMSRFNITTSKVNTLMKQVLKYQKLYLFNFRTGIPSAIILIALVITANNSFSIITISATLLFFMLAFIIGYIQHKRHSDLINEIQKDLQELRDFEN